MPPAESLLSLYRFRVGLVLHQVVSSRRRNIGLVLEFCTPIEGIGVTGEPGRQVAEGILGGVRAPTLMH